MFRKLCYNCGTPITKEYCEDNYPNVCEHWSYKKPITNADRIRSMSDEELYTFIVSLTEDGWSFACSNPPECDPAPENEHKCVECLKRWLQQPAKGV